MNFLTLFDIQIFTTDLLQIDQKCLLVEVIRVIFLKLRLSKVHNILWSVYIVNLDFES